MILVLSALALAVAVTAALDLHQRSRVRYLRRLDSAVVDHPAAHLMTPKETQP